MTEQEARNKVIAQAQSWKGRNEYDGSFRVIIDVYNAGKLSGAYTMTYTDPWCAAFVSAVGMAAGLSTVILPEVSCDRMIALYQKAGRWIEDDNYLPTPGDIIFYDWEDSGYGDDTGSSDHVGIVTAVNGDTITVIEGNKSDSVSYRTMQRGGKFIRGYAVPNYSGTEESAASSENNPIELQHNTEEHERMTVSVTVELPELQQGDTGEAVKILQGILIARGYSVGPDGADGDFGHNTCVGLMKFQRARKLEVDGVAGPISWAALLTI